MKYELAKNTKMHFGTKLFQVRALVSFGNVDAGELGGWVKAEKNLSQEGDAWVYGDARVYGDACVYGDARVSGNSNLMWFSKVGSENGTLTAVRSKDGGILVARGCFLGTIDEFAAAVEKRHGTSQVGEEYRLLIQVIRLRLGVAVEQRHSCGRVA